MGDEEQGHPIQSLMKTAMENLQQMTDVNTIVGDPVETPDGSVIITVSKVRFGFAAGGSEFKGSQMGGQGQCGDSGKLPFGGGSGGGVSITPIAFLVVSATGIQTIHLDNTTHLYEKLMNLAPQAVEKIQEIIKNSEGNGSSGKGANKKDKANTDKDKENE